MRLLRFEKYETVALSAKEAYLICLDCLILVYNSKEQFNFRNVKQFR